MKQLKNLQAKHAEQIQNLNTQINDLQKALKTQSNSLQTTERDRDRYLSEMKGFKDRCRQLETEIEQIRGFEQSTLKSQQQSTRVNEYELKQLKEMYDKKLSKANEEIAKKTSLLRDFEVENLKLKEEVQVLKTSSQRLDREVALTAEIQKLNYQLNIHFQLEQDLRFCFNLNPSDDLTQSMTRAS